MKSAETQAMMGKRAWLFVFAAIGTSALLFALVFGTFRPAPPSQVTLLIGPDGGAYQLYGQRYREAFAAQGIALRLVETSGSVENLRLIKTDPSVDLAFIQGGIANEPDSSDLVQLGSMFPEAVWIFHRGTDTPGDLATLRAARIAVGQAGSGTQLMALQMLAANGFDISDASLLAIGGMEAAEALRRGTVDAAFLVAGSESPAVKALLADDSVGLFSLSHVEAYRKRFRHLEALTLPAGTFDLVKLRPSRDVHMLGSSAMLVARNDLHPAIVSLLLQVGRTVHGGAGLFQERSEYPSVRDSGLPLASQARRFYESGPPFLQRYLPFWLAVIVDRLLVALLPALALLIPLLRIAPPVYAWRMRSRIYRWYGELKFLENELKSDPPTDHAALLARLEQIEDAANHGRVPLAFAHELYTLREHVALVRKAVLRRREDDAAR